RGLVGLSAATSGRAPSTSVALPMKTSPAPSPGTGSRSTRTRITSTSSRAQPVTAIDPATPAVPSVGESNDPFGVTPAPAGIVVRLTEIGPGLLFVPVNARAIVPAVVPENGRPGTNRIVIVNVAGPLPDGGETWIHGTLGVAVQVELPAPACEMRTV